MPATDVTPDSFLDYALRYAALGWPVFPVYGVTNGRCDCGDASCDHEGKHPIRKLARNGFLNATTNPALIKAWWTNVPNANIGVATGPRSGIVVIDVDVRDNKPGRDNWELLQDQHGRIPDTVEAETGSGGLHIVFAWPVGHHIGNSTNALGAGLDVRGDGGYIVVEPSMHICGQPYAWEASSDPLDGVTPAPCPDWLVSLLDDPKKPKAGTVASADGPPIDDAQVLELRSALATIPADDYDTWVKVGMALHSSGAGQQAFGLWCEWAQMSPDKYHAAEQAKKWPSFSDRPDGVALSTIYALAQQHGWVNPASRAAQAFDAKLQESGRTFADLERQTGYTLKAETKDAPRAPLPVQVLEAAAQWMTTAYPHTHPIATDQAVLALASCGAARNYTSPQGDPAHGYFGVVSPSIGSLRYLRTGLHTILDQAGLRGLIRGTRLATPQTVYQTLMRAPSSLYVSADWGQMIQFARRQPSGVAEQALNVIAEAYDSPAIYLDSINDLHIGTKKDDTQPTIYAPSLSMLALVANNQVEAIGKQDEWSRGSVEQMLVAIVPESSDGIRQAPGTPPAPPEWLISHIKRLRDKDGIHVGNLDAIAGQSGGQAPTPVVVTWGVAADAHEQFLLAIAKDDRRLLPLAYGAVRILRRLAVAFAAWDNPGRPVITQEHLDWIVTYVHRHLGLFIDKMNILGSEDGRSTTYQKVLDKIVGSGRQGMTFRNITQYVWAFKNMTTDKRTELISMLLGDKEIVEVAVGNKRKRVYVAARFSTETTPAG
jgi:hypothetical protein